jgi:Skp family chaperone for outer membrane proteins
MNKFFQSVLLVGALLGFSAAPVVAQSRIATVNLVEVFDNYWKTKQAKVALNDSKTDMKKEIDSMQDAHKKLIQAYQKSLADANDQAVSAEEREKRKKTLEPKLKELRESEETLKQFVGSRETELKVKTERMMEDVIKDIRSVVAGKAKAAGYAYVLDSSARSLASTEVVFYSSGESDLTKAVVAELNITAPADAAK